MVSEDSEVHNLKHIFSIKEVTLVYVFFYYIISGLDVLIENYMQELITKDCRFWIVEVIRKRFAQ